MYLSSSYSAAAAAVIASASTSFFATVQCHQELKAVCSYLMMATFT